MSLAISELRESFKLIGYNDNDIVDNYQYVSKSKKLNIDFVLFSNSNKKDIDTSCISVCRKNDYIEINDYFEAFNSIGTPIAIIMDNDNTSFYTLNRSAEKTKKFQVIKNTDVKEFIIENRLSFSCNNIVKVANESQLSLFSIDYSLKEFAKQINKKLLNEKVENTFYLAKNRFRKITNESLEKVLMLILTVLILNDKGYLDNKYIKLEELLNSAINLYPGYFNRNLFDNSSILKFIYEQLREEVVYDRLTDDMLGSFYEDFLITDNLRKKLGIHYTPSYVAKDILERLPIEDIPKDRRVVLDGTCGHGSLILAAYDRLINIQKSDHEHEQLEYLKERLIGIDKDDTATDIAKLLLLLKSLDKTNGWKIFGGKDFLVENLNKYTKIRPTVIVANPPFGEKGRSKEELSEKFVEKYLDWLEDDGLMGIVLPSTFFEKDSCQRMRRKINNECEILEVWTLPPGIFAKANFSSTVLLLRKRKSNNDNTILRYIKKNDRKQYSIISKSSYSSFVPAKLMWNSNNNMNLMFDFKIWETLNKLNRLGDFFEVKNGLQVIGNEKLEALFYDYKPGLKKWVQKSGNLDSFMLRWDNDSEPKYIDLNAKIHRDRKEIKEFIEKRKIVINSKYNPDTLWRVYACIDEEGVFVNETFHIVYPKDNVSEEMLDKLQIILNSIIANLWVYTYSRKRSISPEIIQSIPVCEIQNKEYVQLKLMIEQVKNFKQSNELNNTEIENILNNIDDIIMDCYGFNDKMKKTLRSFFDGYSRKRLKSGKESEQGNTEKVSFELYETTIITGIVEEIQLEEQKIKLIINGIEEEFWLSIKQDFPGWLLKVGTTFKAKVNRMNNTIINIFDFKQLGYSIFDDFDIFDDFFNETNNFIEGSDK